jgi:hypothetical protein
MIWAACPPLFIYGIFRKIERLQCAAAVVFLFLLIDVLIGLNTPNPDHIRIIIVTVP